MASAPRHRAGKSLRVALAALAAVAAWLALEPSRQGPPQPASEARTEPGGNDALLAQAFASRAHGLQVEGQGIVVKVLADDRDGSPHQRFILRLANGQTLLVAHNLDLAPRLPDLAPGRTVAFFGEYEWNARGGVIHWTHDDPAGRHVAGWLRYRGRTYQ